MNYSRSLLLAAVLSSFGMGVPGLQAQIPQAIDFQGTLADAAGNPLNGDQEITFRLYHAATGGSQVWSETETVTIHDGVYSTQLGDQTALTHDVLATESLWLGITPEDGEELLPRVRIVAVPYALRAKYAEQATATSALPPGAMVVSADPDDPDLLAAGYGNPVPVSLGSLNAWTPISVEGAPSARSGHGAVWTGDRMIIWGGGGKTGGIYDPAADTWTATSTEGAPTDSDPYREHPPSLLWTGAKMIVWGGSGCCGVYDPATDSWQNMSTTNAPADSGPAVWTGDEMIAIGDAAGGKYDVATDSWQSISMDNAPGSGADGSERVAFWTGDNVLVWGGAPETGGLYDPNTDEWTGISSIKAPVAREEYVAVWTGTEMIVWGGRRPGGDGYQFLASGARYVPSSDEWSSLPETGAPVLTTPEGVYVDGQLFVWGDWDSNRGGIFDLAKNTWTNSSRQDAPRARDDFSMLSTGQRVIIWGGGSDGPALRNGAIYDPSADTPPYYLYTKQ